jgi:hypothetical protein
MCFFRNYIDPANNIKLGLSLIVRSSRSMMDFLITSATRDEQLRIIAQTARIANKENSPTRETISSYDQPPLNTLTLSFRENQFNKK